MVLLIKLDLNVDKGSLTPNMFLVEVKILRSTVKFENSKFFNLLATIQDEVHRFVITFHRKKRSKSLMK